MGRYVANLVWRVHLFTLQRLKPHIAPIWPAPLDRLGSASPECSKTGIPPNDDPIPLNKMIIPNLAANLTRNKARNRINASYGREIPALRPKGFLTESAARQYSPTWP